MRGMRSLRFHRKVRTWPHRLGVLMLLTSITWVAQFGSAYATFPGRVGNLLYFNKAFRGTQDAFLLTPDGIQQLTDGMSLVGGADWSPDGSQVAFATMVGGDSEIMVANADGTGLQMLTNNDVSDTEPAWSPDGSKIAFERDETWIYSMNSDGSGAVLLNYGFNPQWSPDGSRIAFNCFGDYVDLCIMNADGSEAGTVFGRSANPDWSPDGRSIVIGSDNAAGTNSIVRLRRGGFETLTFSESYSDDFPVVSPDGRWIAFQRTPLFSNSDIYVMRADGSDVRRLTFDAAADIYPDWQGLPLGK